MTAGRLLDRLASTPVLGIDASELAELLGQAQLLREVDTKIAGMLRIVRLADVVLLQEQTPKGELLLRRVTSLEQAEALMDNRLATYERMWDGCGCRVDYFGGVG